MSSTARLALILLAATALTACASKPKPGPLAEQAAPPASGPAETSAPDRGPPSGPVADLSLDALQRELAAAAGDRVFFELDSSTLTADARAVLSRQADWLRQRAEVSVMVAGNCDERGTREYNLALGGQRAASVRDFLVGQGVAEARLQTISYGKERPLDPGSDESAWSRNRNAHTAVISITGAR